MNEVFKAVLTVGAAVAALAFIATQFRGDSYGPPLLTPCEKTKMTLIIKLFDDERAVQAEYKNHVGDEPNANRRRGFAGVDEAGNDVLFLPRLRGQSDKDRIESWGHELAHAACGRWHP